ncbi:extracellular solute-binding protein [Salibacterium halotolerans]|uniref:Multiple sugar transport system substrate-binding protein n=1 Tax=Salibacterium halotolerans TaxID=1884432 RepID=A0A1I5S464_9BACI|nr:extracellular solute-binding protein [Salibacterium halotolerans]SFP65532.1 multiple sugar transport system substrate-binding protein [Salibacterium halotolerans]
MKKTVFAGMVLLFTAAGCQSQDAGSSTETGPVEVEMWSLFSGGDQAYMQSLIDGFNESQKKYEVVMPALSAADDHYTKVVTSVAANRGPDLAVAHASIIPEFYNLGLTKPIDGPAEAAGLNLTEVNENILNRLTMKDGNVHSYPIDTHPTVMFFNKTVLDEAGLLTESGEVDMKETPEGFIDFYKRAQEALPDTIPLAVPSVGYDAFTSWWAFYYQMGGTDIYSDDLQEPTVTLDTETAVEAAEYMKSLFHEEGIIPKNITDPYEQFQTDRALSLMTGVWGTGIWETDESFEFIAQPIPTLFEEPATYGDSHTLFIPEQKSTTDEKTAGAAAFMNYLHENQAQWAKAGHIPANDEAVASEAFQEMPYRSDYADVVEDVEQPSGTIYSNMSIDVMMRNLDEIWAGRVTPEEGIRSMEQELDELVK